MNNLAVGESVMCAQDLQCLLGGFMIERMSPKSICAIVIRNARYVFDSFCITPMLVNDDRAVNFFMSNENAPCEKS